MSIIKPLPSWALINRFPAFYEGESLTAVEQTARVYAKINELIDSYNKYVSEINVQLTELETKHNEDIECTIKTIVKITSDYINTVDLKLIHQDRKIKEFIDAYKNQIAETVNTLVSEMREMGELDEAILSALNGIDNRMVTIESEWESTKQGWSTMQSDYEQIKTDYEEVKSDLSADYEQTKSNLSADYDFQVENAAQLYITAKDNLSADYEQTKSNLSADYEQVKTNLENDYIQKETLLVEDYVDTKAELREDYELTKTDLVGGRRYMHNISIYGLIGEDELRLSLTLFNRNPTPYSHLNDIWGALCLGVYYNARGHYGYFVDGNAVDQHVSGIMRRQFDDYNRLVIWQLNVNGFAFRLNADGSPLDLMGYKNTTIHVDDYVEDIANLNSENEWEVQ